MRTRSAAGLLAVVSVVLLGVGLGAAANASSITVVAECPDCVEGVASDGSGIYPTPGATIFLTITTDSEGEAFTNVYAQVLYDAALADNAPGGSQTLGTGFLATGSLTALEVDGANTVLNQFAFSPTDPGTSIQATAALIGQAPGLLVLSVGSASSTQPLQFGAGNTAPDWSVVYVPEPSIALLLGLGLLGLAARRRP